MVGLVLPTIIWKGRVYLEILIMVFLCWGGGKCSRILILREFLMVIIWIRSEFLGYVVSGTGLSVFSLILYMRPSWLIAMSFDPINSQC